MTNVPPAPSKKPTIRRINPALVARLTSSPVQISGSAGWKYYYTSNASKKHTSRQLQFQIVGVHGGSLSGVLASNRLDDQIALGQACSNPASGIFEITPEEYEILAKKEAAGSASGESSKPLKFYHSGDLGDIVYALVTVKALGGGHLVLGPDNRSGMATRERMTYPRYELLRRLLEAQPYITGTSYSDSLPSDTTCDLNMARVLFKNQQMDLKPGMNIARVFLMYAGLDLSYDQDAWIDCQPSPVDRLRVIFARSMRYRNHEFPWLRIVKQYQGKSGFVGTYEEWQDFERNFGKIQYIPTHDLLDLAGTIKACDLFVGNQSCPYAIAEGLKKRCILEPCPGISNTVFLRDDCIHGASEQTMLPVISEYCESPPRRDRSIRIYGVLDGYSGFGRMARKATGILRNRGYRVAYEPHRTHCNWGFIEPDVEGCVCKEHGPADLVIEVIDELHRIRWEPHDGKCALWTMWESTLLPREAVEAMNKIASVVIVPSTWNAYHFGECGVTAPIRIVPLGIDKERFVYHAPSQDGGKFIFGAAGRFAHGHERKGMKDAVEAFLEAFPSRQDVQMELKCFEDCAVGSWNDPRVHVLRGYWDEQKLVDWYSHIHCFVSPARAEGWGLHQHEAMAVGRPVIACAYAGLAELLTGTTSILIGYDEVPATGPYLGRGKWAEPNRRDLVEAMRQAADNPDRIAAMGLRASKRALEFDWEKSISMLENVLEEFA